MLFLVLLFCPLLAKFQKWEPELIVFPEKPNENKWGKKYFLEEELRNKSQSQKEGGPRCQIFQKSRAITVILVEFIVCK